MPFVIQPRTPPGTLELLPGEQIIFQHMLDVIRRNFERFGFLPIETPVFELKDVLLTKSGGETEKQVYLVQSTGGLAQGHDAELALRFDLTVPLARYVAEHEHQLAFPFRRYQMQRVYRGERAQRGRFREFYQCDIDVIGKDKLASAFEAELPAIIVRIFEELKIGAFTIHFSNRKILLGLLRGAGIGESEQQKLVLREIDKLDKVGADKVEASLTQLGLSLDAASDLLRLVSNASDTPTILHLLVDHPCQDPLFREGVAEASEMHAALKALGVPPSRTRLNLAIARGLDYYTGAVYETLIDDHPEFGSVCSGGRYDDLAGFYTKSKLPGVGLSIGLTRLFDQLRAHGLLPKAPPLLHILVAQLDPLLASDTLALATELRHAGFNVETYLETAKLEKQLKYADKSGIPFVVMLGPDEKAKGVVRLKDLAAKEQIEATPRALIEKLHLLIARQTAP